MFELDEIIKDLKSLEIKEFYTKYLLKSENWYFERILNIKSEDIIKKIDNFKEIVSKNLKVSFNSIMMVGSGKIGYSLNPTKDEILKKFDEDNSDIDIAIICDELFNEYWNLLRKNYSPDPKIYNCAMYNQIYRGYIQEKTILGVKECRKKWEKLSNDSKVNLKREMYMKNEISYRIYRSWSDFEEYCISSIDKLKSKLDKENI